MEKIDTPKTFVNFLEDKKVKNVLIGNGYCLSHPQLGEAFKWDMHQAFCSSWSSVLPSKSMGCPESDLDEIRIDILKKILTYYVKGLFKAISGKEEKNFENLKELYDLYKKNKKWSCSEFLEFLKCLKKGKNVFTINYDPILYFEILGETGFFADGFCGDKFLKQEEIRGKLENSKGAKIFYLHGSWFIQANEKNELCKLSFGSNSPHTIDTLFEGDEKMPHLILEDRWRVKKAILEFEKNIYLKYCYDQLKEIQENLLVFGCSFNKDEHIFDVIKSRKNRGKIYITYLEEEGEDAGIKIKGMGFEPVLIGKNVIWEEITGPDPDRELEEIKKFF